MDKIMALVAIFTVAGILLLIFFIGISTIFRVFFPIQEKCENYDERMTDFPELNLDSGETENPPKPSPSKL